MFGLSKLLRAGEGRTVKRLGKAAGFRVRAVFGNWLAYTLHLQKP